MKKSLALLLCLGLIFSFSACGEKEEASPVSEAVNVETYTADITNIENIVSYTGTLKASESASATSKVSGKVRRINAEIGDYVTAGEVLVTLDDTDYRLQYEQALASYNSVVGGSSKQSDIQYNQALTSAETAYNDALNNYNRQKQLYDMGAVSKVAFDSAETALKNAELALNTARENYNLNANVLNPERADSARAALNIAKNNLNNTVITAPISGYVASKNVIDGQMISPGMEIFSIKNTGSVDAEINVTESVISQITTETKATVSVKSANIDNVPATVSVVNPVKNAQTGMYTVRVNIKNDDSILKDGMFADVTLVVGNAESVLAVPTEALIEEGEETYLYVAEGNQAKKCVVTEGISDGVLTEITSGISKGDMVIVSGKDYITEKNTEIKIVNE